MSSWDYLDFELEIREGGPRVYPVAVRSPAGEAQAEMRFPFDEWQLKDRLQSLEIALLRSGGTRRRIPSPEEHTVQDFGRGLFESLLVGDVRTRYEMSLSEARRQGKGLRLKLRIQPSELAVLPWEFLYDVERDRYPSLSSNTPLVRYLDLPQPVEPLRVSPPLRILGMVASPSGLDPLDVEHEKRLVEEAIRGLRESGSLELTWLEGQTWRHLQRAMRRGPWHIFHFVGHGGFDAATEEGSLALSDDSDQMHLLRARSLAELLDDHYPLRLVFLNSCEGARGSESDAFSSTAATLVRRGVPAVVAMQYEITDTAAIEFSRDFYEALADNLPVDAAVTEARAAVSMDSMLEWGTPVLYMHSPEGQVFDILTSSARTPPSPENGDQQGSNPQRQYRDAVESAWVNETLEPNEVGRLRNLANEELSLNPSVAADVEREVMGDTIDAILERQAEAARREERNRRLADMYTQARRLHRDRKWQAVISHFKKIHSEDPNYPDPEGLLASSSDALELEQRVVTLYDRGQRHMKAEEWQQALESFEDVQRLKPDYRDTKDLLSRVRRALVSPPTVEISDLTGQKLSEARRSLASKGLTLTVRGDVQSDTIAAGAIVEQSPESGEVVLVGSSVSVTVSSGPHRETAGDRASDLAREHTGRTEAAQRSLPASVGSRWGLILRGLVMGIFGLVLVFATIQTENGDFRLYGSLLMIADGLFAYVDAKASDGRRRLLSLQGKTSVLVGVLLFVVWIVQDHGIIPSFVDSVSRAEKSQVEPVIEDKLKPLHAGTNLVGAWAIFIGTVRILAAVKLRWDTNHLLLMGASGGLLVIFGILALLASTGWLASLQQLTWNLLGFLALASGIALIAVALRVRDQYEWGSRVR